MGKGGAMESGCTSGIVGIGRLVLKVNCVVWGELLSPESRVGGPGAAVGVVARLTCGLVKEGGGGVGTAEQTVLHKVLGVRAFSVPLMAWFAQK